MAKYAVLSLQGEFVPIALEFYGPINRDTRSVRFNSTLQCGRRLGYLYAQKYEQQTLHGTLVVTLAMLMRLVNCQFIIIIIIINPEDEM